MKTLILVDVQNDFMPGGKLPVAEGDKIVAVINRIQNQFDLVVATQDWHPLSHESFASNHFNKRPFDKIFRNGIEDTLWPDHCVQGSKGAEFHPDLGTNQIAAIFRKGMDPAFDSYSGFYDNDHVISTGLSGYLKDKGVTELHFCGLTTDICVFYSILDAIAEGFSATLIEDASQALINEDYIIQKKELIDKGVHIINSHEI
ncbi:MAG TPA: bifunctional nicotinamidase/pyrazinamidase [Prolixibacteraceae bacterium]|jgi:nicotinamidase/pyrazinamidase